MLVIASIHILNLKAQPAADPYQYLSYDQLKNAFQHPPEAAKPWVFWYWMKGGISKAGITADLEAMKYAGIAGAYLMPIKDTTGAPYQPAVRQLTPGWWDMMRHALQEADRLGLKIGMHVSDGFALAGGPWITPEMSMQKLTWSTRDVQGNTMFTDTLPLPAINENYYEDIAVFAYPTPAGAAFSSANTKPVVTTSIGKDAAFLAEPGNRESFGSSDSCWIQYAFAAPFTCRSILISTPGNNYQAQRLQVAVSNDGLHFTIADTLVPPRHGWQDTDEDITHATKPVTAKYFRFIYNKAGSEPGSEDLDAAKWKPSLKLNGIQLSGAAKINQFEGKNGSIWRLSARTTTDQIPDSNCVPLNAVINISQYLDASGQLHWQVPAGNWTILRMGHTSTGHTNATAGGGIGLECDKFNPAAIKTQFNGWFGEAVRQAGPQLAADVLKIFHIDSWECGSQNWSPLFRQEFMDKRGYDPLPYLPIMAGIPVGSADSSERFLHDIRSTIAELVADTFYVNMAALAKEKGCTFTAESVAPTMLSDGLLHYKEVDIPMGEFWLNSPTHDKPNDMLDAVSGAHIYGKPIIQAEAFTSIRMNWNEYPAMLKPVQDRNYALGINKLVYHVFMHNPWMDQKPGMTLDGIGLYFQRDQTWWQQGRVWVDYAQRCQALLQTGRPVADIAVFIGEDLPRRSILPDRLVSTLPGLFGEAKVAANAKRLANAGEPLRELPMGVFHSANMADPEDWVNPLHGYAYDSFNPDALLQASNSDKAVTLDGFNRYQLIVLPKARPMSAGVIMSPEVSKKLCKLVENGATLLVNQEPTHAAGLTAAYSTEKPLLDKLFTGKPCITPIGKGRIVQGPYKASSLQALDIAPDVLFADAAGHTAEYLAYTHRTAPGTDIYFIANQLGTSRIITVSLRAKGRQPELWDAVTGTIATATDWRIDNDRTVLPIKLESHASLFIVLAKPAAATASRGANWASLQPLQALTGSWQVRFDTAYGGPAKPALFKTLHSWTDDADSTIRYYSGNAVYTKTFTWSKAVGGKVWLDLGTVDNIASVTLNGIDCGVAWTAPYRVDISKAIKKGSNKLAITVANTWANRLIRDAQLPPEKRITHTTAPTKYAGTDLHPAGLLGPITISGVKQ